MTYGPDLAFIHDAGFGELAESAAPGILELLWRHGIAAGTIVDAGCGSGVLAAELVRGGFEVLGFDPSPSMIALARRNVPAARFETGALDEVVLPRCRAILATGEVLNYAGLEAARAFLEEAGAAIEPGGLLLFDVAERASAPAHEELRIGGEDWSVIVIKDLEGQRLVRRVLTFREVAGEVRRDEERHVLELFDRAVITAALRENGFRVRVRRSYGSTRLPRGYAVFVCVKRV